ncbi:MAG TPA: UbiA family prenyltransferase [Beijerinckiaceae bacterium]|jgi:4-hydroxybenzoate polyprenyltransferase
MSGSAVLAVSPHTLLRLGRVSNLPTVWTNVLAATVLAGGNAWSARTGVVIVAMSLFYTGGMYLNDAFDRDIDARERPSRPIPSGEISASAVLTTGFGMLAAGVALMGLFGLVAALAGLALAGAIVVYDLHHKANPYSPVVMGLCRALVYVGSALVAAGTVSAAVLIGAGALLAHVVGLTYAAKQESLDRIERLWPLAALALPLLAAFPALAAGVAGVTAWLSLAAADAIAVATLARRTRPGAVPQAVAGLIAAIALVDAALAATVAAWPVVIACWAGYGLTRLAHKTIPGT